MIRAVPTHFAPFTLACLSILSLLKHHPSPRYYLAFLSPVVLALHISSSIRPSRVWGVWALGWSCMVRDDLWSLGGLWCEDWSIAWWDYHLFFHEYRYWFDMMRVGLWWAVVLDKIVVYFALRGSYLRLLRSIWSRVWHTIPEDWGGYIKWTLIFGINHLRIWEHGV